MSDLSRRRLLTGFTSALGYGLCAPFLVTFDRSGAHAQTAQPPTQLRTDSDRVFDLSIASGDPSATGVVLWTHVRASAFVAGTPLWFQVAEDAAFTRLVLTGQVDAAAFGPATDHTVKVDLAGRLAAGRLYHYRFVYGDTASRTGRCRTLPAAGASSVKLAALTCQDFGNGRYGAFRHVAEDDSIDFLVHLGDFIYESVSDPRFQSNPYPDRLIALPSGGTVALGLEDYRALYRGYRGDPAFQRALERHTMIAIFDDHETANDCYWDYANDTLGAPDHPFKGQVARLRQLKREAQQAWLEYVPARVAVNASAAHPHDYLRAYRDFAFGDLLRLCVHDTRTYRTPHPCGEGDFFQRYVPVGCNNWKAPTQSLLGDTQRGWLLDRLSASGALWKVIGNQTFFGQLSALPLGGLPINVDAWDGYHAERRLLTEELRRRGVKNLVVLTGDLHSSIASHIKVDYNNINPFDTKNVVGVEFMTPAVTSSALFESIGQALGSGNPALADGLTEAAVRINNPHIAYFNSSYYGYSTVRFTRDHCEWTAYAVDKTVDPSTASRRAIARFRKYTWWPYLVEQSTSGA